VRTVLSGPAAGLVGARAIAERAGEGRVLTLDMGGTSTDVALIEGRTPLSTDEASIAGCVIQLPMLAVHTVGAGGGSIAYIDVGGALKVGPRSAGAWPGPAAYGRGGTEPTVTDADVVLGRFGPDVRLAGGLTCDEAAALRAIEPLAKALDVTIEQAAESIIAVAEATMARALRAISVERGLDPREFTLMPFGGAGALHAVAIARELGITQVLVPPTPGLLCAYGALIADAIYERVRTVLVDAASVSASQIDAWFAPLIAECKRAAERDVLSGETVETRTCALRYRGQAFELLIPWTGGSGADLAVAFHAAHRERYDFAFEDRTVELVTVRARVSRAPSAPPLVEAPRQIDPERRGAVFFEGRALEARVLDRAALDEGTTIHGPAIIRELSATTLIPSGAVVRPERGCLRIAV
jgi:N-methylhydantoinase A